jgi:hypothetical protein
MKTQKLSGYSRSSQVPAIYGARPKVCSQCELWFAALPRQRLCLDCVPGAVRRQRLVDLRKRAVNFARRPTTRRGRLERTNAQVRGCKNLAFEAAEEDFRSGVSYGCAHPKEHQAEPLAGFSRHPYAGERPEYSGYCAGQCNCPHHIKDYYATSN